MNLGRARRVGSFVASMAGLAAATYAGYVAVAWLRYGHPAPAPPEDVDAILDRFMPEYDVVERHPSTWRRRPM